MPLVWMILAASWAEAPYTAYVLDAETGVCDVAWADLSQDGLEDLLVLCCDPSERPAAKYIGIHTARPGGVYDAKPDLRLDLPPEVSALFLAEVDGAPPKELVAADASGASVYHFNGEAFERIATQQFNSLLPSGSEEPMFLRHAAIDLDAPEDEGEAADEKGVDEWLIPVPMAFEVWNAEGLRCRVPCHIVSELTDGDSLYVYHRLPTCRTFQLEGAPAKGIAFLSDEYADFAYGPDWAERSSFKVPLRVEEKWEASTRMDDINQDGFPDIVVTQTTGTVSLRAVTHIYLASAPFTYPEEPTASFEVSGAIASPTLVDMDGDKDKDLVFITVPFGVRNVVNLLVLRKVSVRVEGYRFHEGKFDSRPASKETLTLDAPDGRERVAYTMADFDGDGFTDVAFGAQADKLLIHRGDEERLIARKPWLQLSVPSFGTARAADLNANDRDDLIIFHSAGVHKTRVEVVVF